MNTLKVVNWKEYELIDSGNKEKIERFGIFTVIRPEPQALWKRKMTEEKWYELADAKFIRNINTKNNYENEGGWTFYTKKKNEWLLPYNYKNLSLTFKLKFTNFGHVGIFPEQAENWNFLYDTIITHKFQNILNLFAYTGGASLSALSAGASVTHLDSVNTIKEWAIENKNLSHLPNNIRWIVDDALKFVKKEIKRGKKYDGIILDPPAYGRGTNGEKWILEEHLCELLTLCHQLLQKNKNFLLLNMYSVGLSPTVGNTLVESIYHSDNIEYGELSIVSHTKQEIPFGTFTRFVTSSY